MPADRTFEPLRIAYEGIESADGFAGDEEIAAYRRAALDKSEGQARFVAALLPAVGGAVEVGCGNGRLLIALLRDGAIDRGLGIDIASSRIAFARDWIRDIGEDRLSFVVGDALEQELGAGHALALCVTGAFGYFDAHVPGSAKALLAGLHEALAPGGLLVLELYQHPLERQLVATAGGHLRLWHELPASDPWRFYLSEITVEGELMTHRKTFIHRTDGTIDESREERIVIYTEAQLEAMLTTAGFVDIQLRAGWSDEQYDGGKFLVVTARSR